jgi:hypothetical protein
MSIILNLLITFFILLIGTQIFLAYSSNIIEGIQNNNNNSDDPEYKNYNENDALILSKQNAANIMFLKSRYDDITGMQNEINDLSNNVSSLQTQVNGLVQSQQDYASNITSNSSELSTSYNNSDNTDNNTTTNNDNNDNNDNNMTS